MDMLNYTTKAIEAFQALADGIRLQQRRDMFVDANALEWLCKAMEHAIKFRLPDGGRLFGRQAMENLEAAQKVAKMFHLPYPVTLTEYFVPEGVDSVLPGNSEAPKRICLAIDSNAAILDSFPVDRDLRKKLTESHEPGALVFAMYSDGEYWAPPSVALFFPYEEVVMRQPTEEENATMTKPGSLVSDTIVITVLPGMMAASGEMHGSMERAIEMAIADAVDETASLFEFCSVINCSNVSSSTVTASAALNKKRVKNGKTPMFDYHVLELDVAQPGEGGGQGRGGAGSGPKRMHLRRGHIRRLGEGEKQRRIWINATVVGALARAWCRKITR